MTIGAFIDRMSDLLAAGALASFGGAAQALYQVNKGDKPFSILSFVTCIVLSFFVGQVVGSLIPSSLSQYHDGLLLMSGFSVFPILDIFNGYIAKVVKTMLNKIYPVYTDDTKNESK
jgi:hypothetical protein